MHPKGLRDESSDQLGQNAQCAEAPTKAYAGDSSRNDYVLRELFTYHPVHPDQIPKYQAIRAAAKYFAEVLLANTPYCADQSAAIRKVREAVMTANASIALNGLSL